MPGPVSDSFDPEFGTAANADDVRDALQAELDHLTATMATAGMDRELKNIVDVVHGDPGGDALSLRFTEQRFRIIRFALSRALESL